MWLSTPFISRASVIRCLVGVLIVVFVVEPGQSQTVRNLTNLPHDSFRIPSPGGLDDAGTAAYVVSSSNQFATNPLHSWQVVRWDLNSGLGTQLTSFPRGVDLVSVSDDGQWLAVVSCSDLQGMNHDESPELYVMKSDGTQIAQLTSDPGPNAGSIVDAMIAGSANRIAFVTDSDPLGSNPGRRRQVFVVERDGTMLRQLTNAAALFESISVSDDGNRIVFGSSANLTGENPNGQGQVFVVQSDGTGLRQLSHLTTGSVLGFMISGGGGRIAFWSSSSSGSRIFKIDWDGTGLLELAGGSYPSISDDGQSIVFSGNPGYQLWRISPDGTGKVQLTDGTVPINQYPVISGNGTRVVFEFAGGDYPGGDVASEWPELAAASALGGPAQQLTVVTAAELGEAPQITSDGTRVFFVSGGRLFRIQSDGSQLAQVTNLAESYIAHHAATADGAAVVFSIYPEAGSDSSNGVFKMNTDGTGMTQLTPSTGYAISDYPVLSSDGQWVVFQSAYLQAGTNMDGSLELFRVRVNGSNLWSLTADDDWSWADKKPRLSNGGIPWIVYQSASNKDAQNPDGSLEIFRVRLSGTSPQRLTSDPLYDSTDPDISGDGNRVAYASATDPLGTNPQHNSEIFLYDISTLTRRQLTSTADGRSYLPRIARDGAWVYFLSTASFFEPNRDGHAEPYRVSVTTGTVERLGGTRGCAADAYDPISVDGSGARAAFTLVGDWDQQNPDRAADVYLVDSAARPEFQIGKAAPTLVHWDAEPKPVRYDVIRGFVANLETNGSGVDLGPVLCLEQASPDTAIAGLEDPLQPLPGQVLFYLYRGTQGSYDGPGSWDQGSAQRERIAGPGTCSP